MNFSPKIGDKVMVTNPMSYLGHRLIGRTGIVKEIGKSNNDLYLILDIDIAKEGLWLDEVILINRRKLGSGFLKFINQIEGGKNA